MSRRSLILCLSLLAVMVLGIGLAVAFLYSGVDSGKSEKTTSKVAEQGRYLLLSAVPSDAVLVGCFSDRGIGGRQMTVSMHYSGKLMPLYIYDAGKAGQTSEEVDAFMSDLVGKGLVVRYIDCSADVQAKGRIAERSIVVASASETIVQSALRHLGKSMSVMDAPGFADASKLPGRNDVLFVSNSHASYFMPAMFSKKYSSYSNFISRLADWMVFDMSESSDVFRLHGSALYDEDASEFMNVLASSAPAYSALSEILPSYTLFAASLPVADMDSYVDAYKAYLDSRQALQKNIGKQKSLEAKAGISPYDLMKQLEIKEVATAAFLSGTKQERVNLLRTGKNLPESLGLQVSRKDYVPTVHEWPYQSFVSSVFGPLFELSDETAFTWMNGWLISGSKVAVEEYASGRALEYSLKEYMSDASKPDLLASRKSSFVSYFSFSEEGLSDIFKSGFLNIIAPLYKDAEYSPAVLTVSDDKGKPTVTAEIMKLSLHKTKAPVFERDTVVIVPKGPFEVKNSGTGKMNKFYQNSHLSLCLSEAGKDLWGVPFKEPICGRAYNVDYFANGKLQIIFGAGSSIYLIDRLGRYVTGFPVDLGKDILLGPDVYDFNGTKKYNILVLHKDNTVEMYNLKGQKPSSWKGIHPSETVKSLPERIVVGGSSYWAVRTSMQTLIYPFYGGESLTTYTGEQMIRPDSEVKVLEDGTVDVVCYDGKHRVVRLK